MKMYNKFIEVKTCETSEETNLAENGTRESISQEWLVEDCLEKLKKDIIVKEWEYNWIKWKDYLIKIGRKTFNFFVSNDEVMRKSLERNENSEWVTEENLCPIKEIEDLLNSIGEYVKENVEWYKVEDVSYEILSHSSDNQDNNEQDNNEQNKKQPYEWNHSFDSKRNSRPNYRCVQWDWIKDLIWWRHLFHVKDRDESGNPLFWDMQGIYCIFPSFSDAKARILIFRDPNLKKERSL